MILVGIHCRLSFPFCYLIIHRISTELLITFIVCFRWWSTNWIMHTVVMVWGLNHVYNRSEMHQIEKYSLIEGNYNHQKRIHVFSLSIHDILPLIQHVCWTDFWFCHWIALPWCEMWNRINIWVTWRHIKWNKSLIKVIYDKIEWINLLMIREKKYSRRCYSIENLVSA